MANYFTQTSFAVSVDAGEAAILTEIDEVIAEIQEGFDTPDDAMKAWEATSDRFRQLFPASDPELPFADLTALFDDDTHPSHGAEFSFAPDPENKGRETLYVLGHEIDPVALARLLRKVLPSALPFRFGWAETSSRMRLDEFGGGFIEVTAERLVPLVGLHQELDRQHLVVVVKDRDCGLLFWNNETGFGPLKMATVFTQREADEFRLPHVAGGPPGWLELPPLRALLGDMV